ncbi:MAG: hypothetical protein K5945_01360 [Bacteroidaceae bacterium]|nr:hypothetical protein [Bacteroidaceae bacterium]
MRQIRKYFAGILFASMLPCLAQQAGAQTITKCDNLMKALPGWDIYKAGTYRYGPSLITNDDGSIDAWFAAGGSTYGLRYYNDKSTQSPVQIVAVKNVGQAFTAKESFYRVSVCCPTWNSNDEKVTISVYKWVSTYTSTVRQTPLYTKEVAMTDNMWVDAFYSDEAVNDTSIRFPAGRYLWVLSSPSQHAGVWKYSSKAGGVTCTAYQNGSNVSGSYMMITQEAGASNYWDAPTYQRSLDGGRTWTAEVTAFMPTQGSRDELSACDPGVFRFGGYYYLGYTSTENTAGIDNHLYLARSASPTGPWEKWNGKGWGGRKPQPIVEYTGVHTAWGCGEPSFVVMDSTLYAYYTWDTGSVTTRLSRASLTDENWPANLKYVRTVITKSRFPASDHCDIKYCDDIGQFIAVHTSQRMTESAYINVWLSGDGINFRNIGKLSGTTQAGLHNCGISGDERGHMQLSKPQYIAYAYGIGTWGQWNTFLQPLEFNQELISLVEQHLEQETADAKCDYDISGRCMKPTEKGLHIRQGKKILVK